MRISIVGSGYVGLVSGAGLSDVGHHVLCMDIDEARVEGLRNGIVPIYEPGLESMIRRSSREGRLEFTTSIERAMEHAEVLFIAVGTPPGEDGSADLSHVLAVAAAIGDHLTKPLLVVVKSTVPVGTCEAVRDTIAAQGKIASFPVRGGRNHDQVPYVVRLQRVRRHRHVGVNVGVDDQERITAQHRQGPVDAAAGVE